MQKKPYYNFETELKALFCSTHKTEGMTDIVNKKCIHEFCKKRPNYNFNTEKKEFIALSIKKKA